MTPIAPAREALALFERKGNRPSSDATRAFLEELAVQRPDARRPSPRGEGPMRVDHITSNVSNTMTWAPPSRTGQVSANFAAWSSESASITE